MSWIYLVLAGLCEIGWPLGFKLSQTPGTGPGKFAACIACSVFSMVLSGFLLWLAQRNIPIGTAYAVWTGIGALGTFLVGILWFGDSSNIWRMLAASFLLIGIIGLKLAPGHWCGLRHPCRVPGKAVSVTFRIGGLSSGGRLFPTRSRRRRKACASPRAGKGKWCPPWGRPACSCA